MPNEFSRTRRAVYRFTAALGAVILAGAVWTIWSLVEERDQAQQWVEHTHVVVSTLDTLVTEIQGAETGQRGFLLTGREAYLAPYERGVQRINATLSAISELTRDNPNQAARIAQLREFVSVKLAELGETIRLRREQGPGAATAVVLTDQGKRAMDSIRSVLTEMRREEERLLAERRAQESRVTSTVKLTLLGLAATSALLASAIVWLVRWIGRLQAGLVTVCAWTHQIKHDGEWISAEDYLHRRFGLKITHGISKRAAEQMLSDASQLPPATHHAPTRSSPGVRSADPRSRDVK